MSKEDIESFDNALESFMDQFGTPDIYNRILLEVLFEELLKKEEENGNN
jgi:hypothetical protein